MPPPARASPMEKRALDDADDAGIAASIISVIGIQFLQSEVFRRAIRRYQTLKNLLARNRRST